MNALASFASPMFLPASMPASTFGQLVDSRRHSHRREIMLPCQAVREHDFKLIADRTLDISVDGLLLPLRTRVLTGESLIVSFAIAGLWIDAEATVARVVHGRRPGDDGLAVGVVFDRIAPSARATLAAYLHGRRSPLPRRGPLGCVRRGEAPPMLADEHTQPPRFYSFADVSDADVIDDRDVIALDDAEDLAATEVARGVEVPVTTSAADVDGLGVLRAVVDAWQNLLGGGGAAGAANGEA